MTSPQGLITCITNKQWVPFSGHFNTRFVAIQHYFCLEVIDSIVNADDQDKGIIENGCQIIQPITVYMFLGGLT